MVAIYWFVAKAHPDSHHLSHPPCLSILLGYNPIESYRHIRHIAVFGFNPTLVGGWALPLWKIWKSVGMMTFPIYGICKTCSKPPTSTYICSLYSKSLVTHHFSACGSHRITHQAEVGTHLGDFGVLTLVQTTIPHLSSGGIKAT
jgi:hypothetical protein